MLPLLIFIIFYIISSLIFTIFYHRAFAHNGLEINSFFRPIIIFIAPWITTMDIKTWCCLHRLHHLHSDKKEDPHSPMHKGFLGVWKAQKRGYQDVFEKLNFGHQKYTQLVNDLDFSVNQILKRTYFFSLLQGRKLPYIFQFIVALFVMQYTSSILSGLAYFFGILGHTLQSWLINSFGHSYGSRNFDINDNSKNNQAIALITLGEGYQNNHHTYPNSAKFNYLPSEFDLGYSFCKLLSKLRIVRIHEELLIPTYSKN